MIEFFRGLVDPDVAFVRYALIAGLLASVAFGVVGSYVVVRRISYLAGAIAHCTLGGIGAALYLQYHYQWTWCTPMLGAVAAALTSALLIGLVSTYAKQREDTVISALWSLGMAIGVIFVVKTPGYIDPMSYLFGSILMIGRSDLWLIAGLDALVVAFGLLFYNKLTAVCFDEEFARLRGIHTHLYFLLLLLLTALTIVLLVYVVGIILVIALLTLPAATAGFFARRLWQMMFLAVCFCMLLVFSGLAVGYAYDLPTGPTVVLAAGLIYLLGAVRAFHRA